MNEDIHLPSKGDPDKQQRTLRESMEALSQELAVTLMRFKMVNPAEDTDNTLKELAEQLSNYAKTISKIQPFMELIFEAYPKEAWFMIQPLQVITFPIQAYMRGNGLEDGADIEAHKGPFLEFFREYIEALELAYREDGPAFDLEAKQRELLEAMRGEGLKDSLADLTPITSDFIYGPYSIMPISVLIKTQVQIARSNGKLEVLDVGGDGEENAQVNTSITTEKEIPCEAIEIQNVIGELMQANGNKPITLTVSQIYRAFACMPDGAKVSKQAQEFTTEMIDLLRDAKGFIDFTQQAEKHKKLKHDKSFDYSKAKLEGNLVMADKVKVIAGGKETIGYTYYRLPLFYMHSHLTNQITRIDRALLDTTADKITDGEGKKHRVEPRHNDIAFIMLRRHLARQIEQMKGEKEKNNGAYEGRRTLEGIAEAIGISNPTDKQKRTMRENIEWTCRRWKIQGNIKGYELYKRKGSQAYAGVKIEV